MIRLKLINLSRIVNAISSGVVADRYFAGAPELGLSNGGKTGVRTKGCCGTEKLKTQILRPRLSETLASVRPIVLCPKLNNEAYTRSKSSNYGEPPPAVSLQSITYTSSEPNNESVLYGTHLFVGT